MHILIAILLLLALLFGPQLWIRSIMKRHSKPRADFPGTGGEFARHLLDRLHLQEILVETSDQGDHYDPTAKAVRLTPDKLNGKSLTAITVAAHEVGHALQDAVGYPPLRLRTRLASLASAAQTLGNGLVILAPVVSGISRAPSSAALMLFAGVISFGSAALLHLITLPVEWDASFRRALPVLEAGGYLSPQDHRDAHQILTAAAFTYVAGSLASLLKLWRWLGRAR